MYFGQGQVWKLTITFSTCYYFVSFYLLFVGEWLNMSTQTNASIAEMFSGGRTSQGLKLEIIKLTYIFLLLDHMEMVRDYFQVSTESSFWLQGNTHAKHALQFFESHLPSTIKFCTHFMVYKIMPYHLEFFFFLTVKVNKNP